MTRTLTRSDIEKRISALGPWFHNIELRGVFTAPAHPLGNYPRDNWLRFSDAVPADLTGKSVLDIGCNAGFYAMEMKRRGASRVVAIDEDDDYLAQARFANEVTGFEIEFQRLSVYDVAELGERFDLVLFMGVLYHLRHPLLALDLIHEHVVADTLIFQSMQRGSLAVDELDEDYAFAETAHFDSAGYPKLHFIEHSYAHDWTNWWVPNAACAEALLRAAGFEITAHPDPEVYVCRRSARPYASGAVYPSRPRAMTP